MKTNQKQQLAKEWYNDTSTTKEEKSLLEKFFPELTESEDEKIRKSLIKSYTNQHPANFPTVDGFTREQILAWLEKQGYKSVAFVLAKAGFKIYKDGNKWCILVGDNIQKGICGFGDTVDDALLEFLNELLEKQDSFSKINEKLRQYREYLVKETERWHKNEEDETLSKIGKQDCIGHANAYISARSEFEDLFNYDSWLEKQSEQKSVEWSEKNKKMLGIVFECIRFAQDNYRLVEEPDGESVKSWLLDHINPQTPQEWSEEDEKERKNLLGMLKGWLNTFRETIYKYDCNKAISWLESLKPQPKQQWSEEDESHIERTLSYLESFKAYNIPHIEPIKKEIDWLKSLKERCAFKPTNEQIIALRWTLNNIPYCNHKEEISGLLDQIKNL